MSDKLELLGPIAAVATITIIRWRSRAAERYAGIPEGYFYAAFLALLALGATIIFFK